MTGLEFVNELLPLIVLVFFIGLSVLAYIKQTWAYFYIAITIPASYIYIWIMINLFAGSIGIESRQSYTDLPLKDLWFFIVASIYIFAAYATIGLLVSIVRIFLKLKIQRLFRVSVSIIILAIVTYLVTSILPCNYSPVTECEGVRNAPQLGF